MSVFSKFIRPSGLLLQQSQSDLETIFGEQYTALDNRTDKQLIDLYKKNHEAELDASALITLSKNGIQTTSITLNMLHNGFSRRSWMMPNLKDLYKGNGRVRHEYHNIEQGCLQNIQIHSYQLNDHQDYNTDKDFELGGNNHYDIYIFRNVGIIGGEPLEVITASQVADSYNIDKTKVMNELARYQAIKQFMEVIVGNLKASETKSNIIEHRLSVELMSMIYESGVRGREIKHHIKEDVNGEK